MEKESQPVRSGQLKLQLAGILLVGGVVFFIGIFLIPSEVGIEIVRYGTKPIFYLVYAAVFCLFAVKVKSYHLKSNRDLWAFGWLFVVALLGVLFMSSREAYGYKVLWDEYVICSQAKSLHYKGTSDYPQSTFPTYGEVKARDSLVDKRPPSFSALLAIIHDLTGYRTGNVFFLNGLIGALLFALLLYAARLSPASDKLGSYRPTLWALGLLFSLPLLGQNLTGAGLDLYNVLLLAASALLAYRVLEKQDKVSFLFWLGISFLLFNARYESVLYVVSVGMVILLKSWRLKQIPEFKWVCLMPILLIFFLLRYRVFEVLPTISWQLEDAMAGAFSFSYFYRNIGHAVSYLFVPNIQSNASFFLSYLGGISILVLLVRGARGLLSGQRLSNADFVLMIYGCVVIGNFLLLMCYHWGRVDELEVSRLLLPLFLLFGVCIYRVVIQLYQSNKTMTDFILAIGVAYLFLFSIPRDSPSISLRQNYYAHIDAWAYEQLNDQDDPVPLVIAEGSLFWDLHSIAAYQPSQVVRNFKDFEFHRVNRSFNAYLLEKIKRDPVSGELTILEDAKVSQKYTLEILGEMPYKPYHYARFSRIIEPVHPQPEIQNLNDSAAKAYQEYPIEYWWMRIP